MKQRQPKTQVSLLLGVGIVAFVVGPIVLALTSRLLKISDATLSNVTSMYQIASAVLAALALAGVAISLRQQSTQGKINQVLSLRTMQNDLMRYALDAPETYAACFGPDPGPAGYDSFRRRCYITLKFRYFCDLLYMGEISDNNVRLELLRPLFKTDLGRGYWAKVQPFWLDENERLQGRYAKFIATVEDEYANSIAVAKSDIRRTALKGGRRPSQVARARRKYRISYDLKKSP